MPRAPDPSFVFVAPTGYFDLVVLPIIRPSLSSIYMQYYLLLIMALAYECAVPKYHRSIFKNIRTVLNLVPTRLLVGTQA